MPAFLPAAVDVFQWGKGRVEMIEIRDVRSSQPLGEDTAGQSLDWRRVCESDRFWPAYHFPAIEKMV